MMGTWSIILNVILLVGTITAVVRSVLLKRNKQQNRYEKSFPKIGSASVNSVSRESCDDIIAVRKVNQETSEYAPILACALEKSEENVNDTREKLDDGGRPPLMFFLLAKDDRKLAGYELLQTLLAAGLRFGEANLFHRHLHLNGQGPILCSIAAATPNGTFDMQNIGAFSVRGLCIFMRPSDNATVDAERFAVMLETARLLSEDLDAHLLDDNRQPLNEITLARYRRALNIETQFEAGGV